MHWILQEGFLSQSGRDSLVATLERFDIHYSVHSVVPRVGQLIPEPALEHRNVICMGSYSMRLAVVRNGWAPGIFDLLAQDFEQQRSHWGEHMLNFRSDVCTLADAKFTEERMFVRPTNDSKYFSGRVFTAPEFHDWRNSIFNSAGGTGTSVVPDTRIQVSKPVDIYAEYRFWVVKGEIVTQSLYKRANQPIYDGHVDERLSRFVQERIKEWAPSEAFVIDACDSANGMKVVEINTLNSSALYAADVQRLVLTLENTYSV
jgi:hypothetical protein